MTEKLPVVGFIGLGVMGAPMARNLVNASYDVIGFNRSATKTEAFVKTGGRATDSVADLGAAAEVVITMLPDTPDVESVVLGADGLLQSMRAGSLLIDMSTIAPGASRVLAEAAARCSIGVLDAPVSGGEQGAIDGSLSIMVGGAESDFDRAKPIFSVLGATIVHVGPHGSGQTVKAANQLIVGGTIALVSEALVFLERWDVDREKAVKVLAGGLAGNRILDRKADSMLARKFNPGFRIDLHHKDLGIVMDAARESNTSLPVAGLVAQLMAAARAQGHGALDHSALLLTIESLSGVDEGTK